MCVSSVTDHRSIEVNTALIAATLPSLKPAFRWFLETARNIATSASGRGTRNSVLSPGGGGYKRQFSSGYFRQRNNTGDSNVTSDLSGKYITQVGSISKNADDLELAPLPLYNVTIAANPGVFAPLHTGSVIEGEREMSPERGQRITDNSDALFRSEDGGLEALGPLAPGERGIFRTREITIVHS